ncbi:MAG: hypothetical protein ACRD26_12690 [Vicinamibacterales bacterium]
MISFRPAVAAICVVFAACSNPTGPSLQSAVALEGGASASAGPTTTATGHSPVIKAVGGGTFIITLADGSEAIVDFSMSGLSTPAGNATGRFHHRTTLGGLGVEFIGETTCLSVDPVNNRAWIGGVIVENHSEHPSFTTPRTQPGKDIWFRVLDNGVGKAPDDRSTFVGFEGDAGIDTSEEYCQVQIWPDGNARTWPVVRGNITVNP